MGNSKILVTGSNGQLGMELQALLSERPDFSCTFTDVTDLDITDLEGTKGFVTSGSFDFVVNCAAYTAVDKAESDRDLCDQINVLGSKSLAIACKEASAKLIHISTDFVFHGDAHKPLTETEPTNPVNFYGDSKLRGEQEIQTHLQAHYILRTSWLYSVFGKNFVKTMLHLADVKDQLTIIDDQIGSPTNARDLARLILKIISEDADSFGIYHFSNEGVASWYDFAKAIFEYSGKEIPVKPVPTTAFPTPAKRPHYSLMSKGKVCSVFGFEIPHWRESLLTCLAEINIKKD